MKSKLFVIQVLSCIPLPGQDTRNSGFGKLSEIATEIRIRNYPTCYTTKKGKAFKTLLLSVSDF